MKGIVAKRTKKFDVKYRLSRIKIQVALKVLE